MKKFELQGEVTISVYTTVEAETEEEARELAAERALVSLHATWQDDPKEEWVTSGELDGEVENIQLGEG